MKHNLAYFCLRALGNTGRGTFPALAAIFLLALDCALQLVTGLFVENLTHLVQRCQT